MKSKCTDGESRCLRGVIASERRSRRAVSAFLLSIGILNGCALEDELPNIGDSQYQVSTTIDLDDDLYLSCGPTAHWTRHPDTTFSIDLIDGDTIFVGSDTVIEYPMAEWAGDLIENPSTALSCRLGSPPTGYSVAGETQGRTNQNLHNRVNPNLSDTHFTRAMYTATTSGTHYCDVVYYCGPVPGDSSDPDGQVVIRAGSTIFHHSINEFPGKNWQLSADDWITSTATNRIQTGTWNAVLTTSGFDELVVRWSPQVDNCLATDVDSGNPNAICLPVNGQTFYGNNHDTFFRWRLGVDQYRVNTDGSSTLCKSAVGAWSNSVVCTRYNHHCDTNIYTANFSISETATCGGSAGMRRFTVYADMKKDLDGVPYSDMRIHGGQATNLMVYAHHLP